MGETTRGILEMPLDLASAEPITARQVISTQRSHIAELKAKLSEPILSKIMREFDAAPEDGGWDNDHPICRMALECDAAHKKIAELQAKLERLDQVTGRAVMMGDGVFAGIDIDDVTEIPHAVVVTFSTPSDLVVALRSGYVRFGLAAQGESE